MKIGNKQICELDSFGTLDERDFTPASSGLKTFREPLDAIIEYSIKPISEEIASYPYLGIQVIPFHSRVSFNAKYYIPVDTDGFMTLDAMYQTSKIIPTIMLRVSADGGQTWTQLIDGHLQMASSKIGQISQIHYAGPVKSGTLFALFRKTDYAAVAPGYPKNFMSEVFWSK